MKISEFIEFLNKKIEDHGDIDLIFMVRDYDGGVNEQEFNPEMDWNLHPDTEDPEALSLDLF